MNPTSHTVRGCRALKSWTACAALALAALPSASATVTWKNIQFGGFASQGFLINSGNNDYLGDTSDGTFDFREYALNASWSKGKFRVGAQGFGQRLGDYGDDKITLDWGIVDYQATQWFGVRAGRVKMPRGLYNEALDVDSVRPFVLLPQSVYDARLRDFNAAFNGGMVYGNITAGRAGSFDYRVFYGEIPMRVDSGASVYFNNDLPSPIFDISMDSVVGGSAFWNTPVNGLRVGYSYSGFENFSVDRGVSYGPVLLMVTKAAPKHHRHLISAEYIKGDWVFAAEAGTENSDSNINVLGIASTSRYNFESRYGYVSAARRINSRVELGAYVSHSRDEGKLIPATPGIDVPVLEQTDFALSTRFDINDHLILKLEGHYLDGAGKIFDTPTHPQPFAKRDDSWFMLAAKATFSF
jgi:hypothetical protein